MTLRQTCDICHVYDVDPNFIFQNGGFACKCCYKCGPKMREELWQQIKESNQTCFAPRCGKPADPQATINFGDEWVYCCREHGQDMKLKLDILRGKIK